MAINTEFMVVVMITKPGTLYEDILYIIFIFASDWWTEFNNFNRC